MCLWKKGKSVNKPFKEKNLILFGTKKILDL